MAGKAAVLAGKRALLKKVISKTAIFGRNKVDSLLDIHIEEKQLPEPDSGLAFSVFGVVVRMGLAGKLGIWQVNGENGS